MSNAAEKKRAAHVSAVKHPLLSEPVPHAYALIADPVKPGRWHAVHLTNVVAEGIEHLELGQRPEAAPYGLLKIHQAMETRHRMKKWGKG